MRFGFVVPHADARDFAQLAALGEQHSWDGVFTWEAVWGVHAWVALGAASMVTERIRLGTPLTPAARWNGLLPQIIEGEDPRHLAARPGRPPS